MGFDYKKLKKIFIYGIIFVFSCILILTLINIIMSMIVHSKKEIATPNFINMDFPDAEKLAKAKHVNLKIESTITDPAFAKDHVISQIPTPGLNIREGKEIKIILSQGGQHIEIPDVIGLPQRMAEISIANKGAIIGEEKYRYSVVYEKGKVIEQDPLPASVAKRGDMVNLLISDGEPPKGMILMPKLVGLTLAKAKDILDAKDIKYEIFNENLDEEMFVLSQSIDQDFKVNSSDVVKIYVGTKSAFSDSEVKNEEN